MARRAMGVFALTLLLAGCGGGGGGENSPPGPDLGWTRAEDARTCLIDAGFNVLGGPRPRGDRNAPDVELIARREGTVAFVAFYRREARAARYEGSLRRNAARFGGSVERRGHVSIIWGKGPSDQTRSSIERCAF